MFRKFKEGVLRRTEKNAVKSEIFGEIVVLKKSRIPFIGDFGRIYPIVNEPKGDEEPTWNWTNIWIGGKKNFYKLLFIMLIVALVFYYTFSVIGDARKYMDGTKYVIVEKEAFVQFCNPDTPIISMTNYTIKQLNFTG